MRILITGGNGYIASGIKKYLGDQYNIVAVNRQDFDLRNYEQTKNWFESLKHELYFDVIIHTAITGGNRLLQETSSVLDDNISMYLNLLAFKKYFNKFINIGSGAEFIDDSFYGLSKKTISKSINDKSNFFNLRIYALFDEQEDSRRFIRSNIIRYINNKNMLIYKNKYMDFIYFLDFISILKHYLKKNNLPKMFDCVYRDKYKLLDIATMINELDDQKVDIEFIDKDDDAAYIGDYMDLGINYIGLKQGITQVYRKIYNEKNMVCPK